MAIVVTEGLESRSRGGGSIDRIYIVTGTDDDVDALTAVLGVAPSTYDGRVKEAWPSIKPIWVDTDNSDGVWEATVRYELAQTQSRGNDEIGAVRIRGTTQGGTQHIIVSRATVGAYGTGATTNDNGKLIGATADSVEGCDINVPTFSFSITKIWASDSLPSLATIYSRTAKVNASSITFTDSISGLTITLAAGECLFLGADWGASRADGAVEFSYDFLAAPNETNLSVGAITGITKGGHQYLWTRYQDAVIGGLKIMGQAAVAAYTERVYETADLSGLGINKQD